MIRRAASARLGKISVSRAATAFQDEKDDLSPRGDIRNTADSPRPFRGIDRSRASVSRRLCRDKTYRGVDTEIPRARGVKRSMKLPHKDLHMRDSGGARYRCDVSATCGLSVVV